MKIFVVVLGAILRLAGLAVPSQGASSQPDMILVDLGSSTIFTSPLMSDSNLTKTLVLQYKICVITLPLNPSWILIDLGYMMYGLSQVRLFSDYGIPNAYESLTEIEVSVAEYLPLSDIENSKFLEKNHFVQCGSTGTVSGDTFNAVVDCVSPSRVRWILLKKRGQLHLCYMQILQNVVNPGCFQNISPRDSLYKKAKENLSVFRSNKHVKLLKCQQNCDTDQQCGAIAFLPHRDGTGICQLLRPKDPRGDFFCDDFCHLVINRCHLGERIEVRRGEADIWKIPSTEGRYGLSIEISGEVVCSTDSCGSVSMFLTDDAGKVHPCGTIDHRQYRVLQASVFICKEPVADPQKLIFKADSRDNSKYYTFTSVHIRLAEEGSFALDWLRMTSSFTAHTSPTTILRSFMSSKGRVRTSSSKSSSTLPTSPTSKVTERSSPSKMGAWTMVRPGKTSPVTVTSISPMPKLTYTHSEEGWSSTSFSILSITSTRKVTNKSPSTSTTGSSSTSRIMIALKMITQKNLTSTSFTRTDGNGSFRRSSSTRALIRNILDVGKIERSEQRKFPFMWIILMSSGFLLVLVVVVAVIITFFDGRRKTKKWDIPSGGFCPQDDTDSRVVEMDNCPRRPPP